MAYAVSWPNTLPQYPERNFQETIGSLILRTNMDAGPAKMRKRGVSPDVLSVEYLMTVEQVDILSNFVLDTLDGVTRFGYLHPRKRVMVEARFIPESGGSLFNVQYLAPGYCKVNFKLELLP